MKLWCTKCGSGFIARPGCTPPPTLCHHCEAHETPPPKPRAKRKTRKRRNKR